MMYPMLDLFLPIVFVGVTLASGCYLYRRERRRHLEYLMGALQGSPAPRPGWVRRTAAPEMGQVGMCAHVDVDPHSDMVAFFLAEGSGFEHEGAMACTPGQLNWFIAEAERRGRLA